MAKIKEFGVKANSFETYKRFKDDAEKLGVYYQKKFRPFEEEELRHHSCMWFGKNFKDCWFRGLAMSLSNPARYDSFVLDLDKDYDKALEHLKKWVDTYSEYLKKTKTRLK